MHGNSDLAKLAGFVAGYEKYIEAFTQSPTSPNKFCANKFCSETCPSGTVLLRLGILIPPVSLDAD